MAGSNNDQHKHHAALATRELLASHGNRRWPIQTLHALRGIVHSNLATYYQHQEMTEDFHDEEAPPLRLVETCGCPPGLFHADDCPDTPHQLR